ncbi:hypothetical protein [Ruminococcus sp.]|uniref:hypothetical protein n=1 Tax=Ruminococcus sp. TaxID=41978 RepID=UPI0025D5A19D|nr:hypothetical protein [Ruminococcus sp.]
MYDRIKKEFQKGILFGLIASFVLMLAVAAILLWGFQDGLELTQRCHVSWSKVITFSVATFVVLALQTLGYVVFHNKCKFYVTLKNAKLKMAWTSRGKMRFFLGTTVLFVIIPVAIEYFLLPLIVDQNHNLMWFFSSGMGILCFVITFVEAAALSILQKLIFTKEV